MKIRTPIAGLLAATLPLPSAFATTITIVNTSPNFSLGYGKTSTVGGVIPWRTDESSGVNTPTGSPQAGGGTAGTWSFGKFSFSNMVVGAVQSGAGPTFPNRVLSNGPSGASSGETVNWTNTISVTWTGGTPGVTPEIPTNALIRLNITQISIYAAACCGGSLAGTNLMFSEITPGHAADSSSIKLNNVDVLSLSNAANYKQLVWDPIDFTNGGMTVTRTFVLTGAADFAVDGFEILGNAQFLYDIPEPTSALLLALGSGVILSARRRTDR